MGAFDAIFLAGDTIGKKIHNQPVITERKFFRPRENVLHIDILLSKSNG